MALKDRYLRQVLSGEVVPDKTKLTDKSGLYLLIKQLSKGGVGLYWRMDYQYVGKRKTLAIGTFPLIGITQAREMANAAKVDLSKGVDPSAARKASRQPTEEHSTFKMLADEWLAHKKDSISQVRYRDVTTKLTKYAFPHIGSKSIHDVTPLDVIAIIRSIEALGHKTVARSVVSNISAIFRYAKAVGATDKNPADLDLSILIKPHVRTHYQTVTDPVKIGELLRNIHEYTGRAVTRYCLQLMPLLMLRQGELRGTRWSEIDWDAATLTIRAERLKLRRHMKDADRDQDAHVVPLSRQAVAIFRQLHEVSGMFEHCFYNQRDPRLHISGNALKRALDSMGCEGDAIITPHGFRSMASTLLNEMGWNPDAIERQLAHVDRNAVRRSYNHSKYLDERREMLQAWADYLDSLRAGGNVVPIRKAGSAQAG